MNTFSAFKINWELTFFSQIGIDTTIFSLGKFKIFKELRLCWPLMHFLFSVCKKKNCS